MLFIGSARYWIKFVHAIEPFRAFVQSGFNEVPLMPALRATLCCATHRVPAGNPARQPLTQVVIFTMRTNASLLAIRRTQEPQLVIFRPVSTVRTIVFLGLGCAVLLGSFFLTLWLMQSRPANSGAATTLEPKSPAASNSTSGADRIASHTVSNGRELAAAASASGLQVSPRLRGNVDALKRISGREVTVTGWLADMEGDGSPQNVVAFVRGKRVATVQTQGRRSDVTKTLGLPSGAAEHIAFEVTIGCQTADQVLFVGVGSARQYIDLGSRACP
jgi:hypothetical protein